MERKMKAMVLTTLRSPLEEKDIPVPEPGFSLWDTVGWKNCKIGCKFDPWRRHTVYGTGDKNKNPYRGADISSQWGKRSIELASRRKDSGRCCSCHV